jgi:transcriptional regulator with XRE-family HTH domain
MVDNSYTTSTDNEVLAEIGRRLRALRGARTLEEAAGLAGLTRQTVSRAEHGDNPTLNTIVRMLRAYGRLAALEDFAAAPEVSPMALLRGRQRGRSREGARDLPCG